MSIRVDCLRILIGVRIKKGIIMSATAEEVLKAFSNLCHSRGYTRKTIGDWAYEEEWKSGKVGKHCKLWGSEENGELMKIYDDKVGSRELIHTRSWL